MDCFDRRTLLSDCITALKAHDVAYDFLEARMVSLLAHLVLIWRVVWVGWCATDGCHVRRKTHSTEACDKHLPLPTSHFSTLLPNPPSFHMQSMASNTLTLRPHVVSRALRHALSGKCSALSLSFLPLSAIMSAQHAVVCDKDDEVLHAASAMNVPLCLRQDHRFSVVSPSLLNYYLPRQPFRLAIPVSKEPGYSDCEEK